MKKITILIGSMVMLLMAGCSDSGFKRTKSGLLYKIISDNKGPTAKRGEFIKLHFTQKVRDSILGSSYTQVPVNIPVDSTGPTYDPAEIFTLLRKGDSAVIIMMADTLARKNGGLPDYIKRKDKLTLSIKVYDIFPNESASVADQQAEKSKFERKQQEELERRKPQEIKEIQDYLAKNNIKAEMTKNGVFVEIISRGPGPRADSGKMVSVNYSGFTLDGKYFDSNTDSNKQVQKHPMMPFEFQAGAYGAIQGMLEGIMLFGKGDKGRMFVPSTLGYGGSPRGGGPIKPWDNLAFDIEVIDVKDAPPPQQGPPMPPPQR
jgi:FKBP-type peptidyl-prolyl cis-trans isomerase